jgi:ABC-type polar amino acid transport system ATPase subunit
VGEKGVKLSGGQSIALARTLAGKPELLIWDELTSAPDPNTERGICRNIEALGRIQRSWRSSTGRHGPKSRTAPIASKLVTLSRSGQAQPVFPEPSHPRLALTNRRGSRRACG